MYYGQGIPVMILPTLDRVGAHEQSGFIDASTAQALHLSDKESQYNDITSFTITVTCGVDFIPSNSKLHRTD